MKQLLITQTEPGRLAHRLLKPLQSASLATFLALAAVTSLLLPDPVHAQETVAAATVPVNINAADAATLAAQLSGVGMSRAQEIVRYRETYGPFESIDELADVKGIGPATLDRNRAVITLE